MIVFFILNTFGIFPDCLPSMLCTMAAPFRQRRDADYRALFTVEGVPGEWLEVEMPEEGFVLGVVEFHINLSTSDLPILISCFLLQCHSL